MVRVGSRAECEASRNILRNINLGADVRPLRVGNAALAPARTELDDAWTVLPVTAVQQTMAFVRGIAVDGGLARLCCSSLSAVLPRSMISDGATEPTFTVSGTVEFASTPTTRKFCLFLFVWVSCRFSFKYEFICMNFN